MMHWWVCTLMYFQSTRRLEDMHIRAYKALTQRWKDACWRPQTKVSLLCEDVSLLAAGSRHPHSPLQISTLESSPPFFPSTRCFGLIQSSMKHISMPLTLVELLCNVSFWMAPVSQFLIFRKRGHLEGLPFCRDLVGEVLASAGGCKGTNESLLCAFQPFATSGMHLIPAVWLAMVLRKADNRSSHGAALDKCPDWLPTGKVNLSSCTKQCQPSQLGGLSFESCFSLLCLSLSHRQQPLRFSPTNAVPFPTPIDWWMPAI